ncbi:hypothetical protein Poly51_17270 [Rubripirellula tenax]|uniref:Uncharacterized protein n=1 Tax=Rubripirellula tenax TaxID=2528015 RepID=A0A5C6FFR3_9BACT|nr:hypothetical protein [Rubripirellula tenax]TWU58946.1 hypothetical protein Poly51_17270 [Rubripirellula tenax]
MSQEHSRENVLYAFAVEPQHDQATLERYVALNPELKAELIELAWELQVSENDLESAPEVIDDPGLDAAWEQFRSAGSSYSRDVNPFREARGQKFVELCESLSLPRAFVVAIRDRRVLVNTIPKKFVATAASALGVTSDVLFKFLSESPQILNSLEFKADRKPQVLKQISFEELIEKTEFSEAERKSALGYLDSDRST